MIYLFASHWGMHLGIGISFFNVQTDEIGEQIAIAFSNVLLPGLSLIKPSISTGITYLAETGRWQFMPRAGVGYNGGGGS